MEIAQKILSTFNSVTSDQSVVSRHPDLASGTPSSRVLNLRQRSHTVRPKTSYFEDMDGSGSPATIAGHASTSGDHVISYPQPVSQTPKGSKVKEKKRVNRSSTFRSKEKKEEKEKTSAGGGGGSQSQGNHLAEESSRISEQLYISCISALKSSLEEIMVRVGYY